MLNLRRLAVQQSGVAGVVVQPHEDPNVGALIIRVLGFWV